MSHPPGCETGCPQGNLRAKRSRDPSSAKKSPAEAGLKIIFFRLESKARDIFDYAYLQGPIYFDFGKNIKMGKNSYANFNFTALDICEITIGDNVFIGPNVSLLTPKHPLCWQDRNPYLSEKTGRTTDKEYGAPITIGDNCWIAGDVTVCAGVTIGEGCVIGAGSVVTRDIPSGSIAFGNPCRVSRRITDADRLENHPELF